jgi:7 transmembrane receptor (Secretin family)
MVCNVIVFLLIARSLFQTIEIRRHDVSCLNTTRYKQLVFLFILLGLSWVFALLQVTIPAARIFFAYLFCFAIGSQGIVYFVFFVLMDNKATDAWTKPFRSSAIKYDVHRLTRRAGLIYSTRSSSYSSTSSNSRTVLDISSVPACK